MSDAVIDPGISVVEQSPDRAVLALRLPPDLLYFQGHFPDTPILPGVVQVDWAMRLARRYMIGENWSSQAMQIKFRRVIRPDDPVRLTLTHHAERGRLDFEYRVGDEVCSSGRLVLGAP